MFPPIISIDWFFNKRNFLYFCCGAFGRSYLVLTGWSTTYAVIAIMSFFAILGGVGKLYDRMTWGRSRTMEWAKEVVVITGGSSGLGRVIADTYLMRGVSVAVLDVNTFKAESEGGMENLRFYQCDIGNVAAVQKVKGMVEQEVRSLISFSV